MCIKDNTSSNNSSFSIDILNAPKQEIKIALINPEPLDLSNDSDDSNENEEEFLNLTFNKLGKQLEEIDVFSSYSTRDSDDDAINNIKHELAFNYNDCFFRSVSWMEGLCILNKY
jgi:hypothetical protein